MAENRKNKRRAAKIDDDVWSMATVIAHTNGEDLASYLSRLLRPGIVRDYPKALEKLLKQVSAPNRLIPPGTL